MRFLALIPCLALLILSGCSDGKDSVASPGTSFPSSKPAAPRQEIGKDDKQVSLGQPWDRLAAYQNKFIGSGYPAWDKERDALAGIPIVVTQWASWCTSCAEEAPLLSSAAEYYQGKVAFIGINALDDRDQAEEFLQDNPLGMAQIEDTDGKILDNISQVGRSGLPRTTLISAEGRPIFTNIGSYSQYQDLVDDIERYILNPPPDKNRD